MECTKTQFVSVILDQAIDKPLDYILPNKLYGKAKVGTRVLVPLRSAMRKGTIIEIKSHSQIPKVQKVSELIRDDSFMPADLFELASWISTYYCTSLRRALKMILPGTLRKDLKPKMQLFLKKAVTQEKLKELSISLRKKSPSQSLVLDILLQKPKGILLSELLEQTKASRSPVETLIKKKILTSENIQIDRSPVHAFEFFKTKEKILTSEQQITFDKIHSTIKENNFNTHLIHGITGSGKTEVYLQLMKKARDLKKGVILLVPEIALTGQTIERLKSRFEEKIGILHHRLSDGERFDIWHAIRSGEIQIAIGARSAIFSPIKNLGLIIVDEEHENSYKQTDEAPCYNARDLAVLRGKITQSAVILGSATPSLESLHNAQTGKYLLHKLNSRTKNATLPKVTIVDMKEEYQKSDGYTLFAASVINGIKKRQENGEQSLLFLNRRGYHAFQTCESCKEVVKCPHCSLSLTFHKSENKLCCHMCSYELKPPPRDCPTCKSRMSMQYKGVGTEQVERSLHALFPDIRTIRMDGDTTKHKGSHDRLLKQFRSGKADVLIGTQMIAKGLHFPSVTLVCVLNTDGAINIPDFRASENIFQLLVQVSGRSGRGALPGEVIIQTQLKDNPTIQCGAT
ncbi:MAG: primosomal protein N', partial [Simkaniaceae bacterium]|nr:primosomal protein N' [Simkaniaceae bacterium]